MITLLDTQPLPPGSGPYRVPTLFQGRTQFVAGVFSILGDYRDWSFAGHLWQVCDLPGQGYQGVWRARLYFGRTTIILPTDQPCYLEYDPPYWVTDWRFELWGIDSP